MRIPIAAALIAMLAPLPAAAQDWYRVNVSDMGVQYVDLASIVPDGDYLRANEYVVFATPLDHDAKYAATVAQYDCKNRSARFLRFEPFTTRHVSIGVVEDPDEGKFTPATPGTPSESAVTFICNLDRSSAVRVADPKTDKP